MSHTDPPSALISLAGEVAVTTADGATHRLRGRQPQLVLCYLLVEGRPVERYELAELLWGERLPDHWAGAVRGVLSKVRAWLVDAELTGASLVADDGLVRLALPPGTTTDLDLARATIEQARQALDSGRFADAAHQAERAASLLHGPFLPHGDGDWVTRQRDRFEGLVGTAARIEARALLDGGDAGRAATRAADRVGRDPLDEAAHHLLIQALLASGQRADAVRAYDELTTVLARELGIGPSSETTGLIDRAPASAAPTAPPGPTSPTSPTSTAAPTSPTSPTSGAGRPRARDPRPLESFVGRQRELDHLLEAWTATTGSSTPHLVIVRGDAGIGKTRLADELGQRAIDLGAQVLWGRCRAGSGLAFEPVVELLAEALAADPGLLTRVGPAAGHLAPLIPDQHLPPVTSSLDPTLERTRLFGAVTATLAEVASRPTVWIIDDLQWASPDTAALLELALERLTRPLLVVATYRGRSPTIEASLARLQRTVPGTSIVLDGLDQDDLRAVVRPFHPTDDTVQTELVSDLHRRTGGNPFFVTEITQDARRSGRGLDPGRIPDTARQWIERRAAALDPQVSAVLDLCAVIGLEVDLDLLEASHAADGDGLAHACDTLIDQGLLTETGEPGTLAFPHLISRDAIYERLRSPRRLQLHRRVVQTIEAQPSRAGRDALLAHHLARLGPDSAHRAAAHACAAGDDALGRSAWALAAEHFATAADLGQGDPGIRTRALIGLGRARYRSRDLAGARLALDQAITSAREHGQAVELADAALQLVGRAGRGAAIDMTDTEREALLRTALSGLESLTDVDEAAASERDALLGEIEGELALALLFADAAEERGDLVTRALSRARSARPVVPRHLARALLNRRIAQLAPDQLTDRLADEAEILALPRAELPPEQVIAALAYQQEDRLLIGDRPGARASLTALSDAVRAHPHPYWAWVAHTWAALGCLIDGDVDGAEAAAFAAADLQLGDQGESTACLGVNLISIRLWQRRSGEVIELVADAADRFPQVPCYRAVHALCASKAGDRSQAEPAYRSFAARGFVVPADTNRFLTLAVLADVAVDLGDVDGGARIGDLLAPYGGLQVLLNCYGGGGAYWGPADHQLARLARLAGRHDDADRLFARAAEQADAFGAPLARDAIVQDQLVAR